MADNNKFRVGDYTIDAALFRITHGAAVVPVEPKVFDLLVYLIRHRDRVLSRDELFQKVWDGREVSDATLSNHIKSARRALGDSGELQQTIHTVRGRGYQFVAPVTELPVAADTSSDQLQPLKAITKRSPRRPAWLLPVAATFLVFVAGASLWWRTNSPETAASSTPPTVLVLPLEISGEAPAAWQSWADEITRRVIGSLRGISGLRAMDRATTFSFGTGRTHEHIRQQLPEVRYVLSGVVTPAGNKGFRVTLELDELDTGKPAWRKVYEHRGSFDAVGLTEVEAAIAPAVSQSLQVTILDDERLAMRRLREPLTSDRQALELYVEGWKYLRLYDYESVKKAVALFEQAVARDEKFFDAYLALGEAHRWIFAYYETPRDVLPKVVSAFKKAQALRPDSAEPLSALGLTYTMAWDWDQAWQYLTQAREKDPHLATTEVGFALYYCAHGEPELVKQSLQRAKENDPLNMELADWGNWALFMVGESDAARDWVTSLIEKHPTFGIFAAGAGVGAYIAGDYPRAVKLAEQGHLLDSSPVVKVMLSQAYAYAGRNDEARSLIHEAERAGVYTCPYESAVTYLVIGETDTSMALLEKSYDKRSNCLIFLRVDPRLQPLRKDPRYQQRFLALLFRVGLDEDAVRARKTQLLPAEQR
ncbi:MAG TPA: winged helix-turn-helix domain-containing protein [Steroidobacteraceae bacterium]|nr:winged helix-turn-helix domain-containing protein [Steroidobacteraceae bacterium]